MRGGAAIAMGALALLAGCGKKSAAERERDCKEALVEAYEPTAREVPLQDDFAATAEKRIGPDNYQSELARIARELASDESELGPDPRERAHRDP